MKRDYIIQIAPLLRLPIARTQVFSYLWEKPLPPGTLVEIPFYYRHLQGIVISSKKDFRRFGGMPLKRIRAVIFENFLPAWQIDLADKLGQYYLSPRSLFLKAMVPKIPKKSLLKKNYSSSKAISQKKSFQGARNTLFIGPGKERWDFIQSIVSQEIKKGRQSLIIFPEIFCAYEASKKLEKLFPDQEALLFHGKVARGNYFSQWEKVKSGKAKIIAATKVGIFLPFNDLGAIIVDEEQDISHKQWDMSPRYSAVQASCFLAELHRAKLVLGSSFPSVEAYYRAKKERWEILEPKEKRNSKKTVEVIDIFQNRRIFI